MCKYSKHGADFGAAHHRSDSLEALLAADGVEIRAVVKVLCSFSKGGVREDAASGRDGGA